jgi:AraC family transcriptional regulator
MSTMNNYTKSINTVITEIENSLEFVNIEDLIKLSGYSYYHFHRIFKTHTGESLKKYIKRLQLEKAIRQLKTDKKNVTKLAIEAGFHMPSSFNKAFKEMFDTNPSQYKKNFEILRASYKQIQPLRIETISSFEVYSLRYVGECQYIDKTFQTMLSFAEENQLFDESFELYGITYDDPEVTDDTKLRYDVCIKKKKEIYLEKENNINQKTINGGKYAIFLHQGDANNLINTYNSIFGRWLYDNNINLRYVPVLQKILTDKTTVNIDNFLIELYIPIQ